MFLGLPDLLLPIIKLKKTNFYRCYNSKYRSKAKSYVFNGMIFFFVADYIVKPY